MMKIKTKDLEISKIEREAEIFLHINLFSEEMKIV